MDFAENHIIKMNMTYHFQKILHGWSDLPWWNVSSDMVNIEISIYNLNKVIKRATTESKQQKLKELNTQLCKYWREKEYVDPNGRGFPK